MIINNPKDATFENTILEMENGTELMEHIAHVYFNLMGAESNNKFKELPNNFIVGRYHSWIIQKSVPDCLEVTSVDNHNQIMSIRHKNYNIKGVQFHPESILTPFGKQILSNWINN